MIPFVVIGGVGIVLGGAISAATALSPSYTASWAVAYIVLVAGVAQLVLGIGQARLAGEQPSGRVIAAEAVTFNLANLAVLFGTMLAWTAVVWVGAALIVVALILFVWGVRGARTDNRLMLYGFRIMVAILIVTTPIGLVIAAVKGAAS
ncbi:MAG: hypothetical protein EPN48_08545 [Microbacteriaceae bacterium]|nr:MAG: hypothetical protein EPN48_08545 [Microbacteriaceae bacterium]